MTKEQFETKLKALIRSNLIISKMTPDEIKEIVDHLYLDLIDFLSSGECVNE